MTINILLIDQDQVVRAKAKLLENEQKEDASAFFNQVSRELIPGQTAMLEINGPGSDTVSLEITRSA